LGHPALNDDMPYDQFVERQLAADLIEPSDGADLAALGFLGLGPKYYRRNAPEVMADEWRTASTSSPAACWA
jgi:hypothetical protein